MAERIEWVTDAARLRELEGPWDELAEAQWAPFACHGWFVAWWEAFGRNGEMCVCTVWRDGDLAAALPLWRRGGTLRAMANVHTPVLQVPARDEGALAAAVAAASSAAPAVLEVEALAASDPAVDALAGRSGAAGRLAHVEPAHVSPIVELEDDYAAYRHRVSGIRRLEASRRRMDRDHRAELALIETPSDLEAQVEPCLRLEQAGWKGRRGSAILSAEETARFYWSVLRAYHAIGKFRISTLTLDGSLAAFDLTLLHGERLWTLKGSYNEAHRRLSPGRVLLLAQIERAYELGLGRVELLGGIEPYKLEFASTRREHVTVRTYPHRPSPLARYAYRRWTRPLLKRLQSLAVRTRSGS